MDVSSEGLAIALGREPSPTAADANGWTDLHYAAALNLPELALCLLAAGAFVDARAGFVDETEGDCVVEMLERLGRGQQGRMRLRLFCLRAG